MATKRQVFQLTKQMGDDTRFGVVSRIPGSPAWLAQECYPCEDAPTGWYTTGPDYFVPGSTAPDAAQNLIEELKKATHKLDEQIPAGAIITTA